VQTGEPAEPHGGREPVPGEVAVGPVTADARRGATPGVEPVDDGRPVLPEHPRVFVDDQPALRVEQRAGDLGPVERRGEDVAAVGPPDLVWFSRVDGRVYDSTASRVASGGTAEFRGEFLDGVGAGVRAEFDRARSKSSNSP